MRGTADYPSMGGHSETLGEGLLFAGNCGTLKYNGAEPELLPPNPARTEAIRQKTHGTDPDGTQREKAVAYLRNPADMFLPRLFDGRF